MRFYFDKREVEELLISAAVAAFVFSFRELLHADYYGALSVSLAVFLGFVLHESAHKITAIKYGNYARFVMWKEGLAIALLLAFVTLGKFVFLAPGAVMIGTLRGTLSSRENAVISAAGPMTNILIAAACYLLALFIPIQMLRLIVVINGYIAFFNLLPIPPLDGSKIIWYSIVVWIALMAVACFFAFFAF